MCTQKITKHTLSLWFQLCIGILIKKKNLNRSRQKMNLKLNRLHKQPSGSYISENEKNKTVLDQYIIFSFKITKK